jgi:polyisoprenyl-phosphate glycosyltransferase
METPVSSPPVLCIVAPCFNEQEVLPETASRLDAVLNGLIEEKLVSADSSLLFVDDGSRDDTWAIIERLHTFHPAVTGLKLARNAGHQAALLAGLMHAKERADCVISIDADLQDDVSAVREFVLRFREGHDVVYGVRRSRTTDTWFKRSTALGFYKLMRRMGVNLKQDHADYRLMSRRALEQLARFQEVNLFLRGMVPLVGFPSTDVYYDRQERFAGESKYPLRKMLAFAVDGITSLSVTPIRLVTLAGFLAFGLSVVAGLGAVLDKLLGNTVTGWASLMVSIWFIGGAQLLALGIIGEYIGKIYREVKRRPLFVVEKELGLRPRASHAREPGAAAALSVARTQG